MSSPPNSHAPRLRLVGPYFSAVIAMLYQVLPSNVPGSPESRLVRFTPTLSEMMWVFHAQYALMMFSGIPAQRITRASRCTLSPPCVASNWEKSLSVHNPVGRQFVATQELNLLKFQPLYSSSLVLRLLPTNWA